MKCSKCGHLKSFHTWQKTEVDYATGLACHYPKCQCKGWKQ